MPFSIQAGVASRSGRSGGAGGVSSDRCPGRELKLGSERLQVGPTAIGGGGPGGEAGLAWPPSESDRACPRPLAMDPVLGRRASARGTGSACKARSFSAAAHRPVAPTDWPRPGRRGSGRGDGGGLPLHRRGSLSNQAFPSLARSFPSPRSLLPLARSFSAAAHSPAKPRARRAARDARLTA